MKINIVKIGDKFGVRAKPFIGKPAFFDARAGYRNIWNSEFCIYEYCLFDTEAEAQKVYDIVMAIKNPEIIK